jgi:hypothetical protein
MRVLSLLSVDEIERGTPAAPGWIMGSRPVHTPAANRFHLVSESQKPGD